MQQAPLVPHQRARVGAAACMVLSLAGRPDELRARFDAAVDAARTDDPLADALGDVLPLTYMSLPRHADAQRRLDLAAQLGAVAERTARPDSRWESLHLAYATQVMSGDARCRATFDELVQVAESLHERSRAWEMCYVRSNQAIIDGDLDRARSVIDESLGFAAMVNEGRGAAVFGAHHLGAALLDGTAGALLDSIRELVRTQPGIGAWSAARAYAASIAGETDEAADALDHLLDGRTILHDDPTYTAALVAAGEAAALLADPVRAGHWLDRLEPLAGGWSWTGTCTFGPLDLTRARLALCVGDRRLARDAATAAVATSADMQAPLFSRRATKLLLASFE